MTPTKPQYERALTVAVYAAFAVFWIAVWGLSEPPEFAIMYLNTAILMAVLATPWMFAVRMLFRDWWATAGVSELDAPAQLLSAAASTLPNDRRDWGSAMVAELVQVRDQPERWQFAVGCALTALFPPRANRAPMIAMIVLAIAALAIAGVVASQTVPAMRGFIVVFIALVSTAAVFASVRARPARFTLSQPTTQLAGAGVVVASIAATAYFLVKNPTAAEHFPPIAAISLAIVLACCLWLALFPPRALTTSAIACWLGIVAAVVLGAGFVWTARVTVHTNGGPMIWILFAPPPVFFAVSLTAAAIGRSFRIGVQAAVWVTLIGTLLIFALSLPEAMHRYAIDGRTLGDGETGYPVGVNLPGSIWGLLQIPIFGLPFGVFGAALGRRLRGTLSQPVVTEQNP